MPLSVQNCLMDNWLCCCCLITDAQWVRFCSWFIVPPVKKILCQSVQTIGMWGLLTAYGYLAPATDNIFLRLRFSFFDINLKHEMTMVTHHCISANIDTKNCRQDFDFIYNPTTSMPITAPGEFILTAQKRSANTTIYYMIIRR